MQFQLKPPDLNHITNIIKPPQLPPKQSVISCLSARLRMCVPRCIEDENLLGYFSRKGEAPERSPRASSSSTPSPARTVNDNLNSSPYLPTNSRRLSSPSKPAFEGAAHRRTEPRGNNRRNTTGPTGRSQPGVTTKRYTPNGHISVANGTIGSPNDKKSVTSSGSVNSKRGEKGGGNGFLGFVGMGQWSPPWSLMPVNVQQQEPAAQERPQQQRQRQRPPGAVIINRDPLQYRTDTTTAVVAVNSISDRAPVPKIEPSSLAAASSTRTTGESLWTIGGTRQGHGGVREEGGDGEPRLCVLDARTAVAAMGNKLAGKGVETGLG